MQEDFLTCPICLLVAEQAVESKCCHHIFCEGCARDFAEKACPMCRQDMFSSQSSSLARKMIGAMPVKCPNEGCDATTSKSELDAHLRLCEFRRFPCSFCAGGDFQATRNDFCAHVAATHPERLIALLFPNEAQKKE